MLMGACTPASNPQAIEASTKPWGPADKQQTHILINKSERWLRLMEGERLVAECPVVLGFNPVDDKRMEGDGCTPEGKFKLRAAYPHAKWSRFLWIDYPNDTSVARFERRMAKGEIPADATIGGEVGIHGVPEGMDDWITQGKDWTLGCISLRTADIIQLYDHVQVGTAVEILH